MNGCVEHVCMDCIIIIRCFLFFNVSAAAVAWFENIKTLIVHNLPL